MMIYTFSCTCFTYGNIKTLWQIEVLDISAFTYEKKQRNVCSNCYVVVCYNY